MDMSLDQAPTTPAKRFWRTWRREIVRAGVLFTLVVFGGLGLRAMFHNVKAHIPESLGTLGDRKSTRLNSSHLVISYAVFCLKKKKREPRYNKNVGDCSSINLRGSAHFNFISPTSGNYKDIVFWHDKACAVDFSHQGVMEIFG